MIFKGFPLVVDKWFSMQAMANRVAIFEDFAMLRSHTDFTLKNPNRVRSLYTAFALNNPVRFHDASGRGYALLADLIVELNTLNPQIAARQLLPLREWRRYVPHLQAQMKQALERVLATPNLSNDVFEVASKSLGN